MELRHAASMRSWDHKGWTEKVEEQSWEGSLVDKAAAKQSTELHSSRANAARNRPAQRRRTLWDCRPGSCCSRYL